MTRSDGPRSGQSSFDARGRDGASLKGARSGRRSKAARSDEVASLLRPRLREELRFLHDGAAIEGVPGQLPGRLRVIDSRNGRQFDFTAQEHVLCRSADGSTTIAQLHEQLAALTDTPMSPEKIERFFQRLKFNGLLDSLSEVEPRARQGVLSDPGAGPLGGGQKHAVRRRIEATEGFGEEAGSVPAAPAETGQSDSGASVRPRFHRTAGPTRRFARGWGAGDPGGGGAAVWPVAR